MKQRRYFCLKKRIVFFLVIMVDKDDELYIYGIIQIHGKQKDVATSERDVKHNVITYDDAKYAEHVVDDNKFKRKGEKYEKIQNDNEELIDSVQIIEETFLNGRQKRNYRFKRFKKRNNKQNKVNGCKCEPYEGIHFHY